MTESHDHLGADELRRFVADSRRAQQSQPERLAEARARAEAEKRKALAAEPWSEVMTGVPTVDTGGELTGMLSMPTIEGKELFGTRLAFELLGCCADEERVVKTLGECFKMTRDPRHAMFVAFAALETIATEVFPAVLDILEQETGDYEARVRLADAARSAWAARVGDLKGDEVAE